MRDFHGIDKGRNVRSRPRMESADSILGLLVSREKMVGAEGVEPSASTASR